MASLACCLVLLLAFPASAAEPTAADIQRAASAFDAGSAAYREQRFAAAASFFEAADAAIRSARALRMAIRSREKAEQPARAATLAAQAQRLYPDDAKTGAMAQEVIDRHRPKLHRVDVRCSKSCVLAIGRRIVPGASSRRATIYVLPGRTSLRASFSRGEGQQQFIDAEKGGRGRVRFEPRAVSKPAPPVTKKGAPIKAGKQDDQQPPSSNKSKQPEPGFFASPAFFYTLAGTTVALAAVTVWSGVDTVNNPGADAVREQCAGRGESCSLYQDGLARQLRTNVLIGSSIALGVTTALVGAVATEWSSNEARDSKRQQGTQVRPWSHVQWDRRSRAATLMFGIRGSL